MFSCILYNLQYNTCTSMVSVLKRGIQLGKGALSIYLQKKHIFLLQPKKKNEKSNIRNNSIVYIAKFTVHTCTNMFQVYKRDTNEHGEEGGEYISMNNETNSPRSKGD